MLLSPAVALNRLQQRSGGLRGRAITDYRKTREKRPRRDIFSEGTAMPFIAGSIKTRNVERLCGHSSQMSAISYSYDWA